uniref:Uncharacterized protein n=1 Tax=Utricularia reniformis TaxID=192314 RepID=A0A1Y0B3U8_9LAMI|nr:hypothetical protein AEK19_MT1896 [Utricularia reniformis]ART32064.1 hypothetical protein AEK19_MT1896 [Utricularia reniformis]
MWGRPIGRGKISNPLSCPGQAAVIATARTRMLRLHIGSDSKRRSRSYFFFLLATSMELVQYTRYTTQLHRSGCMK